MTVIASSLVTVAEARARVRAVRGGGMVGRLLRFDGSYLLGAHAPWWEFVGAARTGMASSFRQAAAIAVDRCAGRVHPHIHDRRPVCCEGHGERGAQPSWA